MLLVGNYKQSKGTTFELIGADSLLEYIEDDPNIQLKLVKQSEDNYFTETLQPSDIAWLAEDFHYVKDIIERFPVKSSAARRTLVFRRSNWKLTQLAPLVENVYNFPVFDLETGNMVESSDVDAIIGRYGVLSGHIDPTIDDKRFADLLVGTTTGFLKSLLQKIIRTRARLVAGFNAEDAVVGVFWRLLTHPGNLVPNLRKFVSGAESAPKRVAVSIIEDSYTDQQEYILALLIASRAADLGATIGNEAFHKFAEWLKVAAFSPYVYRYELEPIEIRDTLSKLLNEIGAFKTDIYMFAWAKHYRYEKIVLPDSKRMEDMPLWHAIDQHTNPNFAHLIQWDVVDYVEMFRLIWTQISGVNYRRSTIDETDPFVLAVREAQEIYWHLMIKNTKDRVSYHI